MSMRRVLGVLALTAGVVVGACGGDVETAFVVGTPAGADPTATAGAPATGGFAPREIANVAFALNQAEVDHARIALERASSEEVRQYARRMLDEHERAIERVDGAFSMFDPAAVERDPTARILQRHGALVSAELQRHDADLFDLVYMTEQIAAHATALSLVDRVLLPSSKEGGLAGAAAREGGGAADDGAATVGGSTDNTGGGGATETGGTGGTGAGPGGTGTGAAGPGGTPAGVPGTPLGVELQRMHTAVSQHLEQALRIQQTLRRGPAVEEPPVIN